MDTEVTVAGDAAGSPHTLGAVLAAARVAKGLNLADVARETRVPVRHLAAIEADAHDNLPALPYAIGFVKAFARAVGVDGDMAGARFRAETNKAAHIPATLPMAPLDERRLPPRGVVAASVAALVVVVALVATWSAGGFDPAQPPPAAPPVVAAAAPAATAPATAPAAAPTNLPQTAPSQAVAPAPVVAPPAAPAAGGAPGVVITASEDAWFKVSAFDPAAGKVVTVKTGVLAKGERYAPPPTPGLRLWTGRAGALTITVDGRAIPPLGGPVETVKNVSLDAADLRARLATPAPTAPLPGRAGPPVG